MTDDERAKQLVLEVDLTYSYAQIPQALRPILERAIANAFTAIREEVEEKYRAAERERLQA